MDKPTDPNLSKALALIASRPGVTGESICRHCGINLINSRTSSSYVSTNAAKAFLSKLAKSCVVYGGIKYIVHASFYPAGYEPPIAPKSSGPPIEISYEPPQLYQPPKDVLMQQRIKAELDGQPNPETRTYRTVAQVRQELLDALRTFVSSGKRFTFTQVVDAANFSRSGVHKAAYESEIAAIRKAAEASQATARAAKAKPPADQRQPKKSLKQEPQPMTQPTPGLSYFQIQYERSLDRIRQLQEDLSAEQQNAEAWKRMVELHDTGSEPFDWISVATSTNGNGKSTNGATAHV